MTRWDALDAAIAAVATFVVIFVVRFCYLATRYLIRRSDGGQ
jgi:hypothetical protein